ncbi:HlyD family type I secretion periplasmic adaptor subunit [Hydrogenophaga sp.]|jgi:protease secretion system membrane fusion protein|uniref:HlyD family type I secretion periplasmic adaptor subunit n=1 Tax=Hydrogenophaga sp. TaxID=1904254 RepID=UPI002730F000|nr:HlyD family type I secretion periplasmic adaptor subunit [Hydrogenophaga sp.]MDP1684257.1 HlyD family type I secretion periplasmic adaptor subunit [Hydrogenophaga sp.]
MSNPLRAVNKIELDFDVSDNAPLKTDATRHTRQGWWILLVGLGSFLLWATLAPLDKGVPMSGTVTVAGNKKAVQHLSGGTVEAILVKDGDTVAAGQPLVRMNAVQARANAAVIRVQYHTARSTEARLLAERDGKSAITFPAESEAARNDPRVAATLAVQQQLFSSRQFSLRAELSALDENIAGIDAYNAGLSEARVGKQDQLRFLKEQLDGMRELARDGFMARNRLLELERTYAQLMSSLSEDLGNIARGQRQISELRLRRLQRSQEFQMEVRTQLAEVQKETEALRNQLEGLDHELANAVVKSPVAGTVADVAIFTEGGVVQAGLRMMDIVPANEPLIVEGQVPVHLIDSVHAGLPVELIFSAFNQNTTPRIPGVVTQVSADRLVDEKTGTPYYRMRGEVTAAGRLELGKLAVRPGMPVELFVKTGERTLANYLVRPIKDNLKMALTEE